MNNVFHLSVPVDEILVGVMGLFKKMEAPARFYLVFTKAMNLWDSAR